MPSNDQDVPFVFEKGYYVRNTARTITGVVATKDIYHSEELNKMHFFGFVNHRFPDHPEDPLRPTVCFRDHLLMGVDGHEEYIYGEPVRFWVKIPRVPTYKKILYDKLYYQSLVNRYEQLLAKSFVLALSRDGRYSSSDTTKNLYSKLLRESFGVKNEEASEGGVPDDARGNVDDLNAVREYYLRFFS